MPATEETYRRQPTLHLVFAISSIAMLLSTVWMVLADHIRPWKEVQREFQQVERDKLAATEQAKIQEQKTKYQAQIDEIDAKIKAADDSAANERPRSMSSIESSADWAAPPSSSIPRHGSKKPIWIASAASTTAWSIGVRKARAGLPINQRRRR